MENHLLSLDTQAILLLCASFGEDRLSFPQPLTLSEYNTLVTWLKENKMRPGDLLNTIGKDKLENASINKLDPYRTDALLKRGFLLSLAVEKWSQQGLWIMGRGDPNYPKRLKDRLKQKSPPILYGVGQQNLLERGGLAIVGSRNISQEEIDYTHQVTKICTHQNIQVISGGARGIDQTSMLATLQASGTVLGVLADSLIKTALNKKYRSSIAEGRLTLLSPYDPDAGFHIGNAMGRNKYIYALADYALVVTSNYEQGGTWAGAKEALEKIKEVPVFVKVENSIPEGNKKLIDKGAKCFPVLSSSLFSQLLNRDLELLPEEKVDGEKSQQEDSPTQDQYEVTEDNLRQPKDIYEAVLPFILEPLNQPLDLKSLVERLQVRQGQLQDWLKRAEEEGKVKKTKKPVRYVVNLEESQLSLLPKSESIDQGNRQ
ncbi:DNA-processing protein DprA [Roseofilum reptotaenium CS-1145]|uniref:SMF family protein n=1 Tax=Roseofilum reptotaenium AO1-A TaxID=1925591 RepID=A0A1L9QNK9_9CYAN|nr:DNA-processing protein DprA [Roseofilum reptotaenium]MDB9517563.1 DNA-processing protein DprA [Roseofilum reptotaenium CS-1145]OJJ24254.1 SMF family protein [Roseofilum reptotaenium AO1-A]